MNNMQETNQMNKPGIQLLDNHDMEVFMKNKDKIIHEAQKKKLQIVEPTENEIYTINGIIMQYIRDNHRKLYGGYALNLLVTSKKPELGLYTDIDVPDVDFYSPEPLKDVISICKLLFNKGFKMITGREALHKETYSVRVNNQLYCDITYVPKNIYNKMPYREIDGLCVIGSEFMIIDYFRLITDILLTNWRLEKTVKRMHLLQKLYPLPYIHDTIYFAPLTDMEKSDTDNIRKIMNHVQKYAENNNRILMIGLYAYNQFMHTSNIIKHDKRFTYTEIPYYELIMTEYKTDAIKLISELKVKYAEDIHITEYYPFFQFLGNSVDIYYKDILMVRIYSNNKKCLPYRVVPSYYFEDGKFSESKEKINIGSFSLTIMYSLITIMKARIDNDRDKKNLYYTLISNITEFRNYYFKKMNKTFMDNTIFKEFMSECIGVPITPENERMIIIESRKKKGKKYTFHYEPQDNDDTQVNYMFSNSSGNPIHNIKNLKLTELNNDEYDEDYDENN